MLCGSGHLTAALLVLLQASSTLCQRAAGPAFFDAPPSYYTARTTLRDCPTRFYTNIDVSSISAGGFGGQRVYRGEFQHMVAIGWTRSINRTDYLCGGSLITKQFVLTAAHCSADADNIAPDTVRIGDTDLGSPEDDGYAQQIAIVRFTAHPQYRESRKYFDIAIVELQRAAEYSDAVCNACLWREEQLPREAMDAIGFGATGFGEALSPTLQRVVLESIELNDCRRRIAITNRQMPEGFRQDQFCAAGSTMDTCEGDSGGPIGVKRLDIGGHEFALVAGVVSFGTPCAVGSTGVYTKVSSYTDWIEQETKQSFDYVECMRSSAFCPGRKRHSISVQYGYEYAKNRFGLLWDDAGGASLYECGATLIDDRFLMTSATCVTSSRGAPKFVAHNNEAHVAVTDVYVSPQYRAGSPENNIALLKIAKFVNIEAFRPACLWDRSMDGEWPTMPQFRAFGPLLTNDKQNTTIFVRDWGAKRCDTPTTQPTDLVCYTNRVNLVPRVCTMDHGAPVINGSFPGDPVFAYGLVSPLSLDCGADLYLTDVTPHIPWLEAIIVHNRDQFLVFSN